MKNDAVSPQGFSHEMMRAKLSPESFIKAEASTISSSFVKQTKNIIDVCNYYKYIFKIKLQENRHKSTMKLYKSIKILNCNKKIQKMSKN